MAAPANSAMNFLKQQSIKNQQNSTPNSADKSSPAQKPQVPNSSVTPKASMYFQPQGMGVVNPPPIPAKSLVSLGQPKEDKVELSKNQTQQTPDKPLAATSLTQQTPVMNLQGESKDQSAILPQQNQQQIQQQNANPAAVNLRQAETTASKIKPALSGLMTNGKSVLAFTGAAVLGGLAMIKCPKFIYQMPVITLEGLKGHLNDLKNEAIPLWATTKRQIKIIFPKTKDKVARLNDIEQGINDCLEARRASNNAKGVIIKFFKDLGKPDFDYLSEHINKHSGSIKKDKDPKIQKILSKVYHIETSTNVENNGVFFDYFEN